MKALGQKAVSLLPYGQKINDFVRDGFFSRNKRTPLNDENQFGWKIGMVKNHIEMYEKYGSHPLEESTLYEFGAGWDLFVPMAYYFLGVKKQIIVDERKLTRANSINNVIDKLSTKIPDVKTHGRISNNLDGLESYGITYVAPCDARNTTLSSKSIDFISSTHVMEHIPEKDIPAILQECYRILKDDGIMSVEIGCEDHFSYQANPSISPQNFLRFNDFTWNLLFNSSIVYQNRLRHTNYINMFKSCGFELLEDNSRPATKEHIEKLKNIKINNRFSKHSLDELAIYKVDLIVRKKI